MTTASRQPKVLQVRAGRIGLPYPGTTDPDAVYWVREDEIRHARLNACQLNAALCEHLGCWEVLVRVGVGVPLSRRQGAARGNRQWSRSA